MECHASPIHTLSARSKLSSLHYLITHQALKHLPKLYNRRLASSLLQKATRYRRGHSCPGPRGSHCLECMPSMQLARIAWDWDDEGEQGGHKSEQDPMGSKLRNAGGGHFRYRRKPISQYCLEQQWSPFVLLFFFSAVSFHVFSPLSVQPRPFCAVLIC